MKKRYLRIQALVLALFIILTTCLIIPQQIQAEEKIDPAEETAPIVIENETQYEAEQTDEEASVVLLETENDNIPTEETVKTAVDATTETDANLTESPSESELDPTAGVNTSSTVAETNEAKHVADDDVANEPDDQGTDPQSSTAEDGSATRGGYTPAAHFDFDPATGTITKYKGSSTVVSIPPIINEVAVIHWKGGLLG